MKFANAEGMKQWWGEEEPTVLVDAFSYLHHAGFSWPLSWDDPAFLCLISPIDEDLFLKVLFQSLGDDETGCFSFDTAIHICSHSVFDIEARLDLWEKKRATESQLTLPHVTLWAVDLAHLKWNCVPGPNPLWITGSNVSSGSLASNWIQDWKCYAEPYLSEIRGAADAIEKLLAIPKYVRSSWVKSDGPLSSAPYERAVILLVLAGRRDEAVVILEQLEGALLEVAKRGPLSRAEGLFHRRIRKLNVWASS